MKIHTYLAAVFATLCLASSISFATPKIGIGKIVVKGNGYLQLMAPDGSFAYALETGTRIFGINRFLTGKRRYILTPGSTIPEGTTRLKISHKGSVGVKFPGVTEFQQVGYITAARFEHPENLESIGNGLFKETETSGTPVIGDFTDSGFGYLVFQKKR